MIVTAGEDLEAGEAVYIGQDGKAYRSGPNRVDFDLSRPAPAEAVTDYDDDESDRDDCDTPTVI